MTETPWTPGPWVALRGPGPGDIWIQADNEEVTRVGTIDGGLWETRQANARLIAAAPELVAALEGTVSWCPMCAGNGRYTPYCVRCEDSTDDHYCPSSKPCFQCRDARALLARVRGESEGGEG